MNATSPLAVSLLSLSLAACASAADIDQTRLQSRSGSCAAEAGDAVLAVLAAQNDLNEVLETRLLGDVAAGTSIYRVRVDEDFLAEYSVAVQTSSCEVTGLVTDFGAIPLVDDGALPPPSSGPSDDCRATAEAAVGALEAANGDTITIFSTQLLDAHSDSEILRVQVARSASAGGFEFDSYTVLAESFGGADCLVFGLQRRSAQIDLTATPMATATPVRYTSSFKNAWNTYLKKGPFPEESFISAITFFELGNAHTPERAVESILTTVLDLGIPTVYEEGLGFGEFGIDFSAHNARRLDDMFALLRHWATTDEQLAAISKMEADIRAISDAHAIWGVRSGAFDTFMGSFVLLSDDLSTAVYVDLEFLDL